AGGTTVTVTGTGFLTATGVTFGGTPGTSLNVVSDSSLSVVAPAGSGTVDVVVANSTGSSPTSAADDFPYDGTPMVTGVSPGAGKAAGGTTVTVTGTGFLTATGVTFGGVAGTSLDVTSDGTLTVVAPAGSGTVDVVVANTTGASPTSGSDSFTYDT